jgi:hypothetical protein
MQKTVRRVHYRWLSLGLVAAVAVSTPVVTGGAQGADADFLKGKTFSVVVGYSPGGGYDRYARTLGAHLKNHLPARHRSGPPTTSIPKRHATAP